MNSIQIKVVDFISRFDSAGRSRILYRRAVRGVFVAALDGNSAVEEQGTVTSDFAAGRSHTSMTPLVAVEATAGWIKFEPHKLSETRKPPLQE